MSLFEFGNAQVRGDVRLIRFQSQRPAVFDRSRLEFSLLSESDTKVSMDQSIFRMLLFQLPPQQFSIVEFARSH
jgi:hypothetical protein